LTFSISEVVAIGSVAIAIFSVFSGTISSRFKDLDDKKQSKEVCLQAQVTFEKQFKTVLEMFNKLEKANDKLSIKIDNLKDELLEIERN